MNNDNDSNLTTVFDHPPKPKRNRNEKTVTDFGQKEEKGNTHNNINNDNTIISF